MSSPARWIARLPERRLVALVRHLALDPPVEVLVLEEEHGVRVRDRADEQALGVLRRRRADDLEARDVREEALRVLGVERPTREAAARGQAQHDRDRRPGAVVLLRGHRDEVIPGARDEVGELHLGHRPHAHQRGAGRAGDDRRLGEGHVEHAPLAELLLEAVRDLERPAVDADVLAEHEHALVEAHLLPEPVADRLEVGLLGHSTCGGGSRARRGSRRRRRGAWPGRAGETPPPARASR